MWGAGAPWRWTRDGGQTGDGGKDLQLLHVERGPAPATPFPRSRGWCKLTRRASVVTFQTSTFQAQAAEGTSGQQDRAQRGCLLPGAGQAHSRPPLLPRLIIPRAADHTPHAPWRLTSRWATQPEASGGAWLCRQILLKPARVGPDPPPTQQTLAYPLKPNNITSSLQPP